jgi:hypothetical protein
MKVAGKNVRMDLKEICGRTMTGLIQLRTGTDRNKWRLFVDTLRNFPVL